jgi:osmotically inducible lipoprotein OsmB
MTTIKRLVLGTVLAVTCVSLGACAGMSRKERNTAIGAGAGAVGGAVLTGGSAVGTLGGAAVGGVIGHEVTKDDDKKKKD